jgi:hypothetical protein
VVDVSSNGMVESLRLEVSVGVEVCKVGWRMFYMGNSLVGAASPDNNTRDGTFSQLDHLIAEATNLNSLPSYKVEADWQYWQALRVS